VTGNPSTREAPHKFESRLLPMLLQAVEERGVGGAEVSPVQSRPRSMSRRGRVALVAASTCLVVVGAIVLQAVRTDPLRGGALAIQQVGDVIVVRVADATANPEDMTQELRAAGIDAHVSAEPVTPQHIGAWIEASCDPAAPACVRILEQTDQESPAQVLEIPAGLEGGLRLIVGRPAREGELYADGGANAMAPGGPLACLHLDTMTTTEAEDVLSNLGFEIVWVYETPGLSEPVAERPEGVIRWAWFRGPTLVDVRVSPPDFTPGIAAPLVWDPPADCPPSR
jgi:hypothetical protein